jgi:hypothetical protein
MSSASRFAKRNSISLIRAILEAWRLIHGIEPAPRKTAAAAEGSGTSPRVHQRRAGEGGARKDCRQRIKKLGRTAVFEHPLLGN